MMGFEILGIPVAKARPRIGRGRAYTPRKTKDHEQLLSWEILSQFKKQWEDGPLSVALWVEIVFYLPTPKKKKYDYPQTRPDLDNYVKTVMDAMNGIVYEDDSQVVKIVAEKVFTTPAYGPPRTIIKIGVY